MPKLKDIAAASNLSISTISRYYNNIESLSSENIEKIELAIKELSKNSPKVEEHKKIAIFVSDLSNMFFSEITTKLVQQLVKKHYLPVILNTLNKKSLEEKYYNAAVVNEYSGLIFIGGSTILNDVESEIPIVLIDRDNMKHRKYPVVTSDNEYGGEVAARYLIDKAVKRVIIIDDKEKSRSAKRRIEGFTNALTLSNVKFDNIFYEEEEILKLIKYGANAIFSYSDYHAIEAINLLRRNNIKVPKDVQIVGYDNISLGEKVFPSLTTVTRQTEKLASETVRLISEMITKGKYINEYIKVADYLIVRESTK